MAQHINRPGMDKGTQAAYMIAEELSDINGADSGAVNIAFIEESKGIVHFEPYDAALQIEVYKYTAKETGAHVHKNSKVYSDRIGKRYKVLYQVARGATSWTMPAKYVLNHKKNYFKFGLFNIATKVRSALSSLTIQTVNGGGSSKILILG